MPLSSITHIPVTSMFLRQWRDRWLTIYLMRFRGRWLVPPSASLSPTRSQKQDVRANEHLWDAANDDPSRDNRLFDFSGGHYAGIATGKARVFRRRGSFVQRVDD